jgi:hypothetical protein
MKRVVGLGGGAPALTVYACFRKRPLPALVRAREPDPQAVIARTKQSMSTMRARARTRARTRTHQPNGEQNQELLGPRQT